VWDLVMWQRWIDIELVVWLFEHRLLPLFLLANDLDSVLEIYEPCSLSIYLLPSDFDVLSCGLPASYSFLFLMKVLNLLLNPG
jgi:hypothetical protein